MNALRKNNKNKSLLINQLKLNKKSLELLDIFIEKKNKEKNKSLSSRKSKYNNLLLNNRFSFTSNLFRKKLIKLKLPENDLKINKEKENSKNSINNNNNNDNQMPNNIQEKPLTERNNNIFLKNYSKTIHNFKSRNNSNNLEFPSLTASQQYSQNDYRMNIKKYKNILNKVFSRIKSSYKKKNIMLNNIEYPNNNIKNINTFKRKYSTPLMKKMSITRFGSTNLNNYKFRSLQKLEDYENTLENEFNCKELIKIENKKIEEKLKQYKSNIYKKTPIYKTTEKLNNLLIRQFNLDASDQKTSFNKKYKIYKASVNKIQEIKNKKINHEFKDDNPYEQNKLNLENDIFGYLNFNKNITNKNIKQALNKYYNLKTKKILEKKLELEQELNDLKTKFKNYIEEDNKKKNENNINYGQLNQLIQIKLLYKEIYETDINKKKREFYDEHTRMLHKVRKWSVPSKVVKPTLKQKTINKFKTNIGAYFGSS